MTPCRIILRYVHNNLHGVTFQQTESSHNTNMTTSKNTTVNFHLYNSNFSLGFKVTLPAQSDAGGKVSIWELTVFVIIREKVHMTMCLIVNGY